MWPEDVVDCKVKPATELVGFLPKDTLFATILDPLSDGEQLRRWQQDSPYPVREGTARVDDGVVRGSGIKVCDHLSELLQAALN